MPETTPAHLLTGLLFYIPCLYFFYKGNIKPAFLWLLGCAFLMRLVMIGLDPYLHEWDEQYHAVVAKNMINHPFRPALRNNAFLQYSMTDWCCNYIWLHKQPLFLWQMALSMKVFGVNTIALRLPNAIIGTLILYPVFRIARIWTGQSRTAFLAAFFYACSFHVLELTSGRLQLDHNDIMFGFYVTASIWAFCEYTEKPGWKWAIWTGVLAGGAILIKWLTGLLVFGGWGLYLLTNRQERRNPIRYVHGIAGILACLFVFLPWQIYIRQTFPAESALSYAYFREHIFDDLGHPGDVWFHVKHIDTAFGVVLVLFLILGIAAIWEKTINRRLSIAMSAMFLVVYLFFSVVVATKMPGFTFPVSAIGFVVIAAGFGKWLTWLQQRLSPIAAVIFTGIMGILCMQPDRIVRFRHPSNTVRNTAIEHARIYQNLKNIVGPDVIILNCKAMEDPSVRFWSPNNAYQLFPESGEIDRLLDNGYKVAAFNQIPSQPLPAFWEKDHRIQKIEIKLP